MTSKNLRQLKKTASGVSTIMFFSVIGYALMFIYNTLVARYFHSSGYGDFGLLQTIFKIGLMFSLFGLNTAIGKYLPEYVSTKKHSLVRGFTTFSLIGPFLIALVFGSAMIIFSHQINNYFNVQTDLTIFIQVLGILLPIRVLVAILRKILVARKKAFVYSISYYIIENVTLVLGILAIYFWSLDFAWLFGFYVLSIVLAFIHDSIWFRKIAYQGIAKRKSQFKIKEWIIFSYPLLLTATFGYLITWTDKLVIGRVLDTSQLGIYAVAYSLSILIFFFQSSFSQIFMPLLSENNALKNNENTQLYEKVTAWTIALTIPYFMLLILFTPELLSFIYGAEYILGSVTLLILSSSYFAYLFFGMPDQLLVINGKTKYIFKINTITAIVNVILNIILIPLYGIIGAAIASGFSFMLRGAGIYLKARKYLTIKYNMYAYGKIILAALISTGLSYVLLFVLNLQGIVFVIVAIGAISIFYLLALMITKPFNTIDYEILIHLYQRLQVKIIPVEMYLTVICNQKK